MRRLLLPLLLLLSQSPAIADHSRGFLYPYPPSPEYRTGDEDLTCDELDRQLLALQPLTYPSRPDFYYDPAHGAAIWAGVFWGPAWCYLPYSGVVLEQQDLRRVLDSRRHIKKLRRLKARHHCYE